MRKYYKVIVSVLLFILAVLLCIPLFGLAFMATFHLCSRIEHIGQDAQEIKEVQTKESKFDTSWIENNCGAGEDDGTIRMIGATVYDREGNLLTLKDEAGELWCVEDVTVEDNDCILLWIVDNHTEDDVTDDVVIKIYTEVHS